MENFRKTFNINDFSNKYHASINPETSSKNKTPIYIFGITVLICIFLTFYNISSFAYYFICVANIVFFLNFAFKIGLFLMYLKFPFHKSEVHNIKNFPIYTILLPCYKEKTIVLQNLVNSINELTYPKEKLDIKFLLEESDSQTRENLLSIVHNFEVLLVPSFAPKTKPKACNYGLYKAKGEFLVIFDAEDRPEKNQLINAISKFESCEPSVICVQALLNFYNAQTNWLSRCFAIEYLTWFNVFLPMISKLNLFIPLGGTSNHFRTEKLIEIGGWDAYNVTEDAELGTRIQKKGYKTVVIKSYTMEEAPIYIENWVLQRTRWMKGFLLTFLVHLLDVKGNLKLNFRNFCNLFFSVGFSFFSFFFVPLTIFIIPIANIEGWVKILFSINIFSNFIFILMFLIIAKKEKYHGFTKSILLIPFYFLFHILASFIAFFEIFIKPFYWHKTRHEA